MPRMNHRYYVSDAILEEILVFNSNYNLQCFAHDDILERTSDIKILSYLTVMSTEGFQRKQMKLKIHISTIQVQVRKQAIDSSRQMMSILYIHFISMFYLYF